MGLSQLEAGLLSAEACAKEISELLCHSAECGRSEFHLPATGEGIHSAELAGGNSRGIPFHSESPPSHHPHQTTEGNGRFPSTLSRNHRAAGERRTIGSGPVSTAAQSESRPGITGYVPDGSAAPTAVGFRVPP